MYLLLLAFGLLLTLAGVVLAALGVSLQDHSFDTTIVTPGVVAAVGGFLLIGLGLALRVLNRIEKALAVRPLAVSRPAETEHAAMPPKPIGRAAAIAATAPLSFAAATAERRADALPEKILARAEAEPLKAIVEPAAEAAATASSPMTLDAAAATIDRIRARRRNGSASHSAPRLDVPARTSNPAERPAGPAFDSLWPKASRAAVAAPAVPPAIPATAPSPAEPEVRSEAAPETIVAMPAVEEVTVLKSGVVDGMAYTLFSDGSIEAQLPQGALRFGSITELRNHIEQSA